ncbi:hypothetical protein F1Z66_02765 [Candidatus Nitrosocosmicus sp. SS]|jgi:hypothetical protein|nr:hypothetical protein F1Z66_02765 [Candidatus Nitrosocosmicus sp. SS]
MKKNTSSRLKINHVLIMFAINVLLLSVYVESITVEVNGLLSSNSTLLPTSNSTLLPTSNSTLLPTSNSTLLPTSNSTENETDQKGTIASFPGSLDSDRRHMPLL